MKDILKFPIIMRRSATILAAAMLLTSIPATAQMQWYVPRYITGDVGGGLQSIQFNPRDGKHKVGGGFQMNAGAVFMFDAHWGVSAGVGVASYASKAKFNNMKESSVAYDTNLNARITDSSLMISPDYIFHTEFKNFTEKQKLLQIEIPILAYYQFPINGKFDVVGRAGFKFGIPVSSKYKLMSGTYETSAEFTDLKGNNLNVEIRNLPASEMRKYGFSTVEADKEKGKCKLNPVNFSIMLEGGATYKFTKSLRAYAGINFSYCLTNLHKESIEPILTSDRKYNGTLRSDRVDRASLISVGASAGVIWDFWLAHYKTKPKF